MNLKTLGHCPLFKGLTPDEISETLTALSARYQNYKKNDYIFHTEGRAGMIGIVLSGKVHVIREDYWGNRSLLAPIGIGDMFGEAFACAGVTHLPVSVIAAEAAAICFIDHQKFFSVTALSSPAQTQLIRNMLQILAGKNITLTQKIEHISKRSLREKMLSYLSSLAIETGSNELHLPFNRQELANYLSVDRSALSRELSHMQKDGIIYYKGSAIKLLK